MSALFHLLVAISPYFAAIILLPLPSGAHGLHGFLLANLTFLATFLLFELALRAVATFGKRPRATNRTEKIQNLGFFLITATTTILALGMLSLYNERFPGPAFYALLGLWPLRSLCQLLADRNKDILVLVGHLVYSVGVAYLGFYVQIGVFQWQALIIALAVGFVAASDRLALTIYSYTNAAKSNPSLLSKSYLLLARLYPVCINLGPVLIGLLTVWDELSKGYLACFIVVPLSLLPTQALRALERGIPLKAGILWMTSGVALVFMGILWAVRLLN